MRHPPLYPPPRAGGAVGTIRFFADAQNDRKTFRMTDKDKQNDNNKGLFALFDKLGNAVKPFQHIFKRKRVRKTERVVVAEAYSGGCGDFFMR